MGLFGKKKTPLTRREIVAQRREQSVETAATSPQSYRQNTTLNSRHTASPAESSERLAMHRLLQQRRRLMKYLLAIIISLAVVVSLLYQLVIQVSVISPNPMSASDTEKYTKLIDEYYALRPAERFRFFANHNDMVAFFLEKAPEVKTIRIEGKSLAHGLVKLTFRQPVARWDVSGKTYFVDDSGVTFERNYFQSPSVIVKDESGVPTSGGDAVANRQFLSFLGQAVSHFHQKGYTVTEVILPANTVRQVHFRLKDHRFVIKTTVDRGVAAQVAQADASIRALSQQAAEISYIDVRVDQRSFYK